MTRRGRPPIDPYDPSICVSVSIPRRLFEELERVALLVTAADPAHRCTVQDVIRLRLLCAKFAGKIAA
jgi:hypothetical protein